MENHMSRVVALVQARMASSRLPGKVLAEVAGRPMILHVLDRVSRANTLHEVVLATSDGPTDDQLAQVVTKAGFSVFRGSEDDVLGRFCAAAAEYKADVIIRITGDCPMADPSLIDRVVRRFLAGDVEYVSNVAPPTYPDGLDVEVFSTAALLQAGADATETSEREHVTPYIRAHFTSRNVTHDRDLSDMRLTVDEPADLAVTRRVFQHFGPRTDFTWTEVLGLFEDRPDLFSENQNLVRNEGATMGKGQKLWKRAKQVIPGGNMLLSKRAEMFLPDQWPAYFSRAKGCMVWDLDGNAYVDMGLMGVGTNTLGYGHDAVDAAAQGAIEAGNLSTLNCPEEVALAERLVELHDFADMARFARSGGEANAIAIRIARAASGRDGVAVCGYHGWHDWYLSANLGADDSLAGHLLPGLDPAGVPRALRGVVHPFNYNDLEGLKSLCAQNDIGVIKMEVSRNAGPQPGFLEGVRRLADEKGIVLVFDECTSGFRETYGGLYKKFGVEPDLAVFGKTLGNGYAITAVIGRREVMEAAQTTFISSTFWTERIGPAAAVKTLEVMKETRSWEGITEIGTSVREGWTTLAAAHGLQIETFGLPALCGYRVASDNALEYKTLITQEMLAKGYLAGTSCYASLAHTEEIRDAYFNALDPVFALIRQCETGEKDVHALLKGPVCHDGFKRLN